MAQGFDAWGIPSNLSDGNDTFGLPLAYTGLPYDQEAAGLTYAHARWYDAGQGRFVSRDPLGGSLAAPASQNRYAYALDNPTTFMDPSGLGTISGAGGGVGGGGRATSACGGCALALANTGVTQTTQTAMATNANVAPFNLTDQQVIGLIIAGSALAILGAIIGAALAPVLIAVFLAFVVVLSILLLMEAALAAFPGFFGQNPGIGTFILALLLVAVVLFVVALLLGILALAGIAAIASIATATLAWAFVAATVAFLIDAAIMAAFWLTNRRQSASSTE